MGPTASGKSALALELARAVQAEIIAMDSMQIYRGMDIGTAKPTAEERRAVSHHLLDVADPREAFSVSDYVTLCKQAIDEISARGKLPLLVGGTGFYLKAMMYGLTLGNTPGDLSVRDRLSAQAATEQGKAELHRRLQAVDPITAARLHPNDVRRVVRALEVWELTGEPFSAQKPAQKDCPYRFWILGTELPRERLYARIDARVLTMMDAGLPDEVRALLGAGVPETAQSMQGLGYKELVPILKRNASPGEAVSAIQQGSRHYAKRQITWFRAEKAVHWLSMDEPEQALQQAVRECRRMMEMDV